MTDLTEYEAAARWLCAQRGEDPEEVIGKIAVQTNKNPYTPGTYIDFTKWKRVAKQIRDHDLMSRALAHGRSESTDDKALLAAWNAWGDHAFGKTWKLSSALDEVDTSLGEYLMSENDFLDALKAAITAYEKEKG